MKKNLRDIVRTHIEEETLHEFLEERYNNTPENEKKKFLDFLSDTINRQVETMLNEFVIDIQKGSPEIKRKKAYKIGLAIVSIIATAGLALAVNEKNVAFISVCSLIILASQVFHIIIE